MAVKHPYKLAEIVHHGYDLSKRWYVIFYAWDVSQERVVRKRLFEGINKKKTVTGRLEEAGYIVRAVNRDLREGKVLGKEDTPIKKVNLSTFTVTRAIEFIQSEKKDTGHRENYTRSFLTVINNWKEFLEHKQIDDITMRKLTRDHMFEFFGYLKKVKKVSNKTHNNYRNYLATTFNFLLKRDPKLFTINPASVIDSLPVVAKKHAAFTDKQVTVIIKKCKELKYNQLLLFIQFVYYTLARPNELIQLKISNIDLEGRKIFIPGEVSKTKFDETVGISDRLYEVIKKSGVMKFPPDYYVFGFSKAYVKNPGPKRYATPDPMWRKNQEVLKEVNLYQLNNNYSLYSYKHSGAISLYQATKDIKLVQRQCRHKTLNQTNEYLRDLGLMSGLEGLNAWEGAA